MPRGVYERIPGRRPKHTDEAKAKMSAAAKRHALGNRNAWKTGRTKSGNGYVFVTVGKDHPLAGAHGRVLEHRLVMAESIGRLLRRGEVVHHINGRTDDNRLENLTLYPNQKAHMAQHPRGGTECRP